jgi:hypothetical protein
MGLEENLPAFICPLAVLPTAFKIKKCAEIVEQSNGG